VEPFDDAPLHQNLWFQALLVRRAVVSAKGGTPPMGRSSHLRVLRKETFRRETSKGGTTGMKIELKQGELFDIKWQPRPKPQKEKEVEK